MCHQENVQAWRVTNLRVRISAIIASQRTESFNYGLRFQCPIEHTIPSTTRDEWPNACKGLVSYHQPQTTDHDKYNAWMQYISVMDYLTGCSDD